MKPIFIAGFQHETNTFAPTRADWAAFEATSGFAAYARGAQMLQSLGAGDLPIGGFVRAAQGLGWPLWPSLWAGATPSAHVTREAFDRILRELLEDLEAALAAGGVSAVYLDLHGAAVAEQADDAEGELLSQVRQRVGGAVPIVASLDLHANLSPRMLSQANALVAYRTYPHIDTAATGARAAQWLAQLLADRAAGIPWHSAMQGLPFLLPLNAQCSLIEPARSLYALLESLERESGVRLSFCMGFPAADIEDCGAVVSGHGRDAAQVREAVGRLAQAAIAQRPAWRLQLLAPQAAVRQGLAQALALALNTSPDARPGPVVIADTQDNPGAGGDGNTSGLLHALLAAQAGTRFPGRVALALLCDPEAAAQAHALGLGAEADFTLGKAVRCFDGALSDAPVRARARVAALHGGRVQLHGPMRGSGFTDLGPCVRLDVQGVQVLVCSRKTQVLDLGLIEFLGLAPAEMALIVVKSSVHFRAAFADLARDILVAQAPGPMAADPADLPWRKLPAHRARRP